VRVLVEPKNAVVKQYKNLFELDNVELIFTEEALHTTAEIALRYETGARGLRGIMERVLLDVMYEIPSRPEITKVTVSKGTIQQEEFPVIEDSEGNIITWTEDGTLDTAA
jgi:ATP-dependent Clp protease ATP-binding subunit ClpX